VVGESWRLDLFFRLLFIEEVGRRKPSDGAGWGEAYRLVQFFQRLLMRNVPDAIESRLAELQLFQA